MKIYTKDSLVAALKDISNDGWIKSCRETGNHGAVGNTLEQLLEIDENNLPLPDAGDWELKGQRRKSPTKVVRKSSPMRASSLLTLFHMEPSPREYKFVADTFLPKYGWPLAKNSHELSFRLTIGASDTGGRGFRVVVDDDQRKVLISFNAKLVANKHSDWLRSVEMRAGLGELNPQPYWDFDDLQNKLAKKLKNTIYVMADAKNQNGAEYFKYNGIFVFETFNIENFLQLVRGDLIKVDFDARSGHGRGGHNHGTKFRMNSNLLPSLYAHLETIIDQPLDYTERLKQIDLTAIRSRQQIENMTNESPISIQMPLTGIDEE